MPGSNSQKAKPDSPDAAGVDPDRSGQPSPAEKEHAPIFIVASPRPQVGKTFLARLLLDFLRLERNDALAFDLNPNGDALKEYLPAFTAVIDLTDIKSQMAMFDRLVCDDGAPKIVDLGHASFARFFAIAEEIELFREARSRAIEPVVLFAADPHSVAIDGYADLKRRLRGTIVIPIFNAAILKGKKLREEFPFNRPAAVPIQIAALAPMLKAQVEKSRYSFAEVHGRLPMGIPIGLAFELRSWIRRTFLEFRELELRLLLERLRAALPGVRI